MPEFGLRSLRGVAVAALLAGCGGRAVAVVEEEPEAERSEVSAEAVQHVLEGHLAKLGNQRAEQLAALGARDLRAAVAVHGARVLDRVEEHEHLGGELQDLVRG